MSNELVEMVLGIRMASRTVVRELGFMNRHLAGTDLAPSQVHLLLEVELHPEVRASELADLLRLNKSNISRLLAGLQQRGYVIASTPDGDGRVRRLALTDAGRRVLQQIHRRANRQVELALAHFSPSERAHVLSGLQLFATALQGVRPSHAAGKRAQRPRPQPARS